MISFFKILYANTYKVGLLGVCTMFFSAVSAQVPSNNECEGPIELTPAQTFNPTSGTTNQSTVSSEAAPSCLLENYGDVWYSFVATSSSLTIRVTNLSPVNPAPGAPYYLYGLAAYSGDCAALSEMTSFCGTSNTSSTMNRQLSGLTVGHTYYLRLWSDRGFDFNFNFIQGTGINFDIGIIEPMALAISMKSIEARRAGNANKIIWETANEAMGDYFELERSTDGGTFKFLSKIIANGKASDYTYHDKTALANDSYYRLKLISKEGHFIYSKIVKATLSNNDVLVLNAHPNPVSKSVTIKVSGSENGKLFIADISGKVVSERVMNGSVSEIDFSKMASGLYFIRYTDGNFSKTIKITRQ